MACNCGTTGAVRTVHEVHLPDGTVRRFLTEAEARAAAGYLTAEYRPVQR